MPGSQQHKVLQTWKTRQVPEHWKPSLRSVRRYLPDWEHVLLDDVGLEDCVRTATPWFLEKWRALPHAIQRVDAARYVWLWHNGGLYMDLDIEILSPSFGSEINRALLSGLPAFVQTKNPTGTITNCLMASPKGHPLMLECVRRIHEGKCLWYGTGIFGKHLQVMGTTGPGLLDKVIREGFWPVHLLPSSLLLPNTICDVGRAPKPGELARALPGGSSWASWDTRFLNCAYCYPWRTTFGLIFLVIGCFCLFFLFKKHRHAASI